MAHNDTRSVADLRRESERTRAELTQTVDTLRTKINDTADDIRQKVSPEHIKSEVSDYVAAKGRHWFENLKQQALDNPMQALAAGAAIAVPGLKIIRSVPLPLLMIGAGVALSSSRVRTAVADQVDAALRTADGTSVIDSTSDLLRNGLKAAKQRVDSAGDAVIEKVTDVRDAAAQTASGAMDRAAALGDAAKANVNATVKQVSEAASEALSATQTQAGQTLSAGRSSVESVVRENAALVGGLGLAIGALIAASLPSTRAERATLGGASDALLDQTAKAASKTFDEAKTAVGNVVEAAGEKISEAAFGSDLSRATSKIADRLKTVADDAVTTAFEPSNSDHR